MRLVNADKIEPHEQLEPLGNGKYEYVRVAYMDDIDALPTVDAVPVVRCKDCKSFLHGFCRFHNAKFVRYNGYCYWGERKDGDGNGKDG